MLLGCVLSCINYSWLTSSYRNGSQHTLVSHLHCLIAQCRLYPLEHDGTALEYNRTILEHDGTVLKHDGTALEHGGEP